MIAKQVFITPACRITRIRKLPIAGRVLVNNGQSVSTNEVIASIDLPDKNLELNVSEELGVNPNQINKYLSVSPGERIQKGDEIAHKGGLLNKTILSPVDGRVSVVANGKVLVENGSNPIDVKAGFTGLVKEIISNYGAIVVGEGALLQGVWGNGILAEGLMICMARNRTDVLTPDRMDVNVRGSVVFGGPCTQLETLRRAVEIPLRGLVVSGITPNLIEYASSMPFPVMALIGIGKTVYDDHTFQIISNMDKRVACVNASALDHCSGIRPEVVVPKRGEAISIESTEVTGYKAGQLVRILQSPAMWETARIKSLLPEARRYPSGIVAESALCILSNGEEIAQPLVNLEVIL